VSRLGIRGVARRFGLAIAVAWIVSSGWVRPVAAAEPIACPNPAGVTVGSLLDLRDEGGPLAERFRFLDPNERGLACFHDRPLTFVAFIGQPEGLGGVMTYWIRPEWLDVQLDVARWLTPTDEEIAPGFSAGPFLEVSVEPDRLATFDSLDRQWVDVTAQFDHPAAQSCQVKEDLQPGPERPTPAELIEICRSRLVVTGVEPTDAPTGVPPPAATSAPQPTPAPRTTPTPRSTPTPRPTTTPTPTSEPTPGDTPAASPNNTQRPSEAPDAPTPAVSPHLAPSADPASSSSGAPWPLIAGAVVALAVCLAIGGAVAWRRGAFRAGPPG
jgi:hypothetical protein